MASNTEHTTLVCLFHHTDRAERTVQELLEIGIPQSAITLIGKVRTTADIDAGNATLDTLLIPEADRPRLMQGLRNDGSIVAVSAAPGTSSKIEDVFERYSADKIDEKVMTTPDYPVTQGVDASLYPGTIEEEFVELVPVSEVIVVDGPAAGTVVERTFALVDQTVTLNPTDFVEDTDLVEPPSGSYLADPGTTDRFDPDAPLDNVRNPAADRLNDPLNRR